MNLDGEILLLQPSPGLQLAALSTIPASIVKHAEEISTQIQQQRKVNEEMSYHKICQPKCSNSYHLG